MFGECLAKAEVVVAAVEEGEAAVVEEAMEEAAAEEAMEEAVEEAAVLVVVAVPTGVVVTAGLGPLALRGRDPFPSILV
jgi:predicted dinucleotide-binding enzyme